jgi:hypothetical protein
MSVSRRPGELFGGIAQAEQDYGNRYHAACRTCLSEVDLLARATIVLDNPELPEPCRIGRPSDGGPAARIAPWAAVPLTGTVR